MDLDEIVNYAINREILLKQKGKMQPFRSETDMVALVKQDWTKKMPKRGYSTQSFKRDRRLENAGRTECSRCGSWRHHRESEDCIARNASCNKCGVQGHFARKCRVGRNEPSEIRYSWKKSETANAVRDGSAQGSRSEYPSRFDENKEANTAHDGTIVGFIDQLPVEFLIDSGASINTVTEQVWENLVASNARLFKKKFKCDRQFTAYACQEPLQVLVIFEAWITINETKPKSYAEFFVIQGAQKSLLSKRTAEELKVLKVGLAVLSIVQDKVPFPKFPNIQLKLSIDRTVSPRKVAYLKIPVAMEEKVNQKLQQMLNTDIIEPVFGPSEWISPMVVVPKGTDDIRLCINMRYPNQAIQREHYPLPLIDTLLNKLKGAVVFSSIDITSAYYHVELHPTSREITKFMTGRANMRMCEMFAGIEGVVVYIDDIVVWGSTLEEHDERLQKVLNILEDNRAMLNKEKCVFGVKELEILGFKVGVDGISPTDAKVAAIRNFRMPETKEEVRSFLDAAFDESSDHFVCGIGEGPSAITLDDIRKETNLDDVLKEVVESIKTQVWPSSLCAYQAFSKELGVIQGVVVRDDRIILPSKLLQRALDIAHRGHPGVVSMKRNLREKVWWPYMDRDVEHRVQECAGCVSVSSQGSPEPMHRKEMPNRAWQDLAIDFFSAKECATFLVLVDYYSRFLSVTEMKSTNARKTIEVLESVFKEHTYPETDRTDNGPPFASEEFSNYCLSKNIRLVRSIPYWPQMNGLVERQNQGILRTLRIARTMKEDRGKAVEEYVYSYNTTPHSVTGKSPMELLTGRPVKDLLPSLRTEPYWNRDEETRDKDIIRKMQGKLYADKRRHARTSEIVVGDTVMIKNYEIGKLETAFRPEKYTVIKKSGSDVVVLSEDGVKYRRPITHLKKYPILDKQDAAEIISGQPDKVTDETLYKAAIKIPEIDTINLRRSSK
ncbi:uncharacterized protein K02A2.6-like [Toxorhynchites rutilus septentrionalis]|uniref:uncharacterized protein K02A2.6-like n=1 Tax=Toxorhynchites rutilus septentrionalis TaxID=329112 RepID=UPI0024792F36|nr:uncharacterized protein K02A2.6-like [Toxorhynchites rutilus septentrionalis]